MRFWSILGLPMMVMAMDMSCPSSPNCVSSMSPRASQYIEPFYIAEPGEVMQGVKEIMLSMPRTELVSCEDDTCHFTAKTALFGFVDDVYMKWDPSKHLLYMKSASRTGYYDFETNRRRLKAIKLKLTEARVNGAS